MTTFLPSRSTTALLVLLASLGLGLAFWLRFALIENAALGNACDAAGGFVSCPVRQATIVLFNYNIFGGAALVAAFATLWRPNVSTLSLAVVASALGLILYNTTPAAFAVSLIVLALARPASSTGQERAH